MPVLFLKDTLILIDMLNRIIHFSLRNRLVILVVALAAILGGTISLLNSEVDVFPDLNAPTVVVMTEAPGMAPEEIEQSISFPIETSVNGATGVRRVRSSSSTGFSTVSVEFDWSIDPYRARQIVAERIAALSDQLPTGAGNPTIGPQSSIMGEVLLVGLTADSTSLIDLRSIAQRQLKPRLLSVAGVSQVTVIGGEEKEVAIKLQPDRMRLYGVTIDDVLEATESMSVNAVGGILNDYGREYLVKGVIRTSDVNELGNNVVAVVNNVPVRLSDIATVEFAGARPLLGVASVEASPAVIMTVTKQPGVGTIELNNNLLKVIEESRGALPPDVHINTDIFSQSTFIDRSINNLQVSLFEGALFVIIILFFFLANVRTTIISVVSLPVSIVITVLVLHFLGISINTMTLGGIAIAIGSLVDDAIVDVENVYKRLRENGALPPSQRRSARDVIYSASSEVRIPVINSSLIIIASFLPLFFLSGMEGRMLIPLGLSFIVALISSTVVALTLTPALCSFLLEKQGETHADKEPWLTRRLKSVYNCSLGWVMVHGRVALGVVALLVVGAVVLFFSLGRGFLPGFNEGSFTINISVMPGISLEENDRVGRLAEELILSVPEVKTVARKTGRAELDEHALGSNVSELEVPYELSTRSRAEVAADIRRKLSVIPGANIEVGQPISHRLDAMLSGTEAQVAVKIFGSDLNTLALKGDEIKRIAKGIDGFVDVNVEQLTGRPQLDIIPNRNLLAAHGISLAQFRRYIGTALQGEVVSVVYDGAMPFDLRVKVDENSVKSIDELLNMPIDTPTGSVPLSAVAEVVSTTGPNTINRENVSRRLVVSANVENRDLRSAVNELKDKIDAQVKFGEGYFYTMGGQFESEAAASSRLMWLSIVSLVIIFLLLYGEFRNMSQSLVIMVNMPLAMTGGIFILALTGSHLNIPAIIGFISLMGISTRNGMLLISRYNQLRSEGLSVGEVIRRGSVDRLTPIMMTALTSALALIPLAIRGGEAGNEIQAPMAIVILGGLITSTILNLYVLPIIASKIK